MRRYAVMLKRRQRNTITLRQLFNEWLPIHSQSISDSDYRGQQGVGDQIMFIIIGN